MFCFLGHQACGILALDQELNLHPLRWKAKRLNHQDLQASPLEVLI